MEYLMHFVSFVCLICSFSGNSITDAGAQKIYSIVSHSRNIKTVRCVSERHRITFPSEVISTEVFMKLSSELKCFLFVIVLFLHYLLQFMSTFLICVHDGVCFSCLLLISVCVCVSVVSLTTG